MFADAVHYFAEVGRDGKRLDGDFLANIHQLTFALMKSQRLEKTCYTTRVSRVFAYPL
jgi:hypothetical protein